MKKSDKIVIDSYEFDAKIGYGILKLKYPELPGHFPASVRKNWDSVKPATFKEIATHISDTYHRRKAIQYLGVDRLLKEIESELIGKESIKKQALWMNSKGGLDTVIYEDEYELHAVRAEILYDMSDTNDPEGPGHSDAHYVKCKDTSTGKTYIIWVKLDSVASANHIDTSNDEKWVEKINPIMAIAWTIQTTVEEGSIEKIYRQGDCILIKKKPGADLLDDFRHLTEKEYRTLLVNES